VVLDGTSTKDAVIDVDFSISSLQINSGYTGTVSQGGATLTISGPYTQTAGTFNGGSGVLNLGSNFSLNGGTFSANSGTVAFVGSGGQAFPPTAVTSLAHRVRDLRLARASSRSAP